MLEAAFVRRRGGRDRVYVTRADGTSTGWDFPSYGDWLPHDLCHLVVEEELGLTDGFWGLVDLGIEVGLVNNQATLMRDGAPLVEHAQLDLTGLMEAEAAVAAFSGPASTEAVALPLEAVATIRRRLQTLAERWRALDDGGAITLTFSRQRREAATPPGADPRGRDRSAEQENRVTRKRERGPSSMGPLQQGRSGA